jgi:hypothetical protein
LRLPFLVRYECVDILYHFALRLSQQSVERLWHKESVSYWFWFPLRTLRISASLR